MPETNRLLDGLPHRVRQRLLAVCDPLEITAGTVLLDQGEISRHAYFPLGGIIGLASGVDRHQPLETGLVGNEGMLGATLTLGIDVTPCRATVHGGGRILRVAVADLRRAFRSGPGLQRVVNRYLYVGYLQLSVEIACQRFHDVERRLARRLLMMQDRAHADHFFLTHTMLANMLGVRRSAVTIAAGELQRRRHIDYSRGEINIVSRVGLCDDACSCYAALIASYDHWLV
ncbi:MAG: Crp/Fnr family transcriptional regulator [Gammaproteobacteria bacterium]|nr:Crp/Fnr family transcriptional regulator [Gammaproteobacteria bacterium]